MRALARPSQGQRTPLLPFKIPGCPMRRVIRRGQVVTITWVLLAVTGACSGDLLDPGSYGGIGDFVSGAAAINLGGRDTFSLAPPEYQTIDAPRISGSEAVALARLFPAQFWDSGLDSVFAQGHGTPVQLSDLGACGRVLFSRSALAATPLDWDQTDRRYLGEFWLVGFCNRAGELQGHVAVSAYATDVSVSGPNIVFPRNFGNEFKPAGVPPSWQAAVPYSPEGAVAAAYRCTHRRIIEVPKLLREAQLPTTASKWQVQLDSSVQLYGAASGHRYETAEVYVGLFLMGDPQSASARYEARVGVAVLDQPSGIRFQRRTNPLGPDEVPPPDYVPQLEWTDVARLPGRPITFEAVRCS